MRKTAKNRILWVAGAVCAALVMLAGCDGFGNAGNDSEENQNPGGNQGQQQGQVTTYTVTFYPNVPEGAVGAERLVTQTRTYNAGSEQQIPEGLFSLDGYRLAGWADTATATRAAYSEGDRFTVYGNKSFYAVWEISINTTVNGLVIKDNVVMEFKSDSGITAVVIPDGVVAIEDGAFGGCAGLLSLTIPASVTSIGREAFIGCGKLTVTYAGTEAQWNALGVDTKDIYVIYGDGTTSGGTQPSELTIENRVVVRCDPKAEGYIRIVPGVTGIAANAFEGCSRLEAVIIPDGVITIGGNAFKGCTNLLTVEMPGSVTYIGSDVFEYCYKFKTVNFTGTLTRLTKLWLTTNGFGVNDVSVVCGYGTADEGICHFGDGLTIVNNIVEKCDPTLTGYVIIPNGVLEIAEEAFKDCAGVMGVGISGSVTSIGDEAFENCSSLTSIALSNTQMKKLGSNMLAGCNIKGVSYTGTFTEWIESEHTWVGALEIDGKSVREISEMTADDFAGITKIGSGAFANWTGLTRVIIPNSVIVIGDLAFNSCRNLMSVTIPVSVTSIGREVFSYCEDLGIIMVASGNRKYHSDGNCLIETETKTLIAGCKTSVIPMDGSVASIAEAAFLGCLNLTSVTIPDGITCIDSIVFAVCSSLTSVKIPSSVTSINSRAFYGCISLTSVQYDGTKTEWDKISREDDDGLSGKTITGNDGTTWTAK